ncbi:MAG: PEP-CTERM sorting domain-containing protein [Nitrosomonadales bacterium]|nr:PEP-CTERM sorting domain-containing protein [Nitrosomonadales bacterium]
MRKYLASVLALAALVTASAASALAIGPWNESGFGEFDAIGMTWISGSEFSATALTLNSGATGWSETSNAQYAFASFDSTSSLYFTTDFQAMPGSFALYAWRGDTLVDSALVNFPQISSPWSSGAPTRIEQFVNAGGQVPILAPVPEPETYAMMLVGLGLLGFTARRQRAQS